MLGYTDKVYNAIAKADDTLFGVQFAAVCVDAAVPVQIVANWFGVSRQAVYFWFTGVTGVAHKHRAKMSSIAAVLRAALRDNALPAEDIATTMRVIKTYRDTLKHDKKDAPFYFS